jgi:hypothetical protein
MKGKKDVVSWRRGDEIVQFLEAARERRYGKVTREAGRVSVRAGKSFSSSGYGATNLK